ncbi:MAG: L,D-transpeptidase family protein [Pseudobdellovibrionaceae bacterium]
MRKFLFAFSATLVVASAAHAGKYNCSNVDLVSTDTKVIKVTSVPREYLLKNKIIGDKIIVSKAFKKLYLFKGDILLRAYDIALGGAPYGPKLFEGDNKTPEGKYIIDFKKEDSGYHRALHISYPNSMDIENTKKYSKAHGLNLSPGGAVMIHGFPNGREAQFEEMHPLVNWTNGCIAVNNEEIEDLFELVPEKTEIDICPSVDHRSH